MSERTERAAAVFAAGFNCSQAVFTAFAEDYDIEQEQALKIAAGFGGGMRSGEVCGAVTGALMVIGAARGHYIEGDTGGKADSDARIKAFMAEFRIRKGEVLCRGLLGFDPSTPEGGEKFKSDPEYKKSCHGFVDTAIEILEEFGY